MRTEEQIRAEIKALYVQREAFKDGANPSAKKIIERRLEGLLWVLDDKRSTLCLSEEQIEFMKAFW